MMQNWVYEVAINRFSTKVSIERRVSDWISLLYALSKLEPI
jgi:hypothetical protein